ncbi:MAG: nucleoside triphosphate pyrophosphohydrolase [Gammaproteobacteria bacterium]|nr:nucleoside triphosphate pyrophosphohydrolase [Gammaproteobacteria bacterium]
MSESQDNSAIARLLVIMRTLRDPDRGCAWDRRQTINSIAPYTLEEAYEIVDAIEKNDMPGLCDELGDVLFHIVFYARMAEEQGLFNFTDVVTGVCNKLVRRHPHVFGAEQTQDTELISRRWEEIKAAERRQKGTDDSALSGITGALPGLVRARKLQQRAAQVGFDWVEIHGVVAKLREELDELEQTLNESHARQIDEMGDTFFSLVNLARHLNIDPETAVRHANQKFERRFRKMEHIAHANSQSLQGSSVEQLDALWREAKHMCESDGNN